MFVNIDSIKQRVADAGKSVSVTHYFGDVTFGTDQEPSRDSESLTSTVSILKPSKRDIELSLGKITMDDKKLIFPGDSSIDLDDTLTITGYSGTFKVKEVINTDVGGNIVKKAVFASHIK